LKSEQIHTLYAYNYWCNRLLLDTAEKLAPAQLSAPAPFPWGSLQGTLVHTLWAEWIWRSRMQHGISPGEIYTPQDFPTLESLRARWQQEEQEMWAFLGTLDEEDMQGTLHYQNTRGKRYSSPLWHALLHLVNHGTQHRSEVAAMLTACGHSPGDIDLIVFLRQQQVSTAST
jgi:uncharacterized damage-inducible protein DinB